MDKVYYIHYPVTFERVQLQRILAMYTMSQVQRKMASALTKESFLGPSFNDVASTLLPVSADLRFEIIKIYRQTLLLPEDQ